MVHHFLTKTIESKVKRFLKQKNERNRKRCNLSWYHNIVSKENSINHGRLKYKKCD